MKLISKFNIEETSLRASAISRVYNVIGEEGAAFTIMVQNKDGDYYNFPKDTIVSLEESAYTPIAAFSSTPSRLSKKTIPQSGVFTSEITFPLIDEDDNYFITLIALENTEINSDFSNNNKIYVSNKIYKYIDTVVTFSLLHSSSAVVEPSNYTKSGKSSQVGDVSARNNLAIDWDFTLGSSTCTVLRQPVASDFEFTITKRTKTAGTDSTSLELKNIQGLSVGMVVSGTGIATGAVVKKVIKGYKNEGKSTPSNHIYDIPVEVIDNEVVEGNGGTVTLSLASTLVVDRSITFTGKGSKASNKFNKTKFKVKNFKIALNDIVTTLTAATTNAVIPVTSANGIKAQEQYTVDGAIVAKKTVVVDEAVTNLCIGQRLQVISSGTLIGIPTVTAVNTATKTITLSSAQTLADGITLTFSNNIVKGIGLNNSTTDPFVVSISSNNITVNANQVIEDNQTVTFIGSSRAGKITANIEVFEYGDNDITLTLNLDNILKVG